MSSEDAQEQCPEHVDKGKRRASEPTERTPLLVSSSRVTGTQAEAPADSRRRLRKKLTTVFLLSLSTCVIAFVLLALLAWSYASRVSALDPDAIIHQDLVFSGPNRVQVLHVSQAGAWLNVQGKIGMDAGKAIGVGSDPDDGLLKDLWKSFGRWSVRTLDRVAVNMTTIRIAPDYDPAETLFRLDIPSIEVPLTVDPPTDLSWLTTISTPVFVRPTSNTTLLHRFLKESWRRGSISVRAHVGQAVIRGGSLEGLDWRSRFSRRLSDIRTSIDMNCKFSLFFFTVSVNQKTFTVPSIPGFPTPGRNTPFPSIAEIVTLTSFGVSSRSNTLFLHGTATAINPAPSNLDFSGPSLPFEVSIMDPTNSSQPPVHVASVTTLPFILTRPNITLSIQGTVPPIAAPAFPVLSMFISRYLSAQPNTVLISSPLLFPDISAEATFPSPNPPPKILRSVTIKDMKIKPSGGSFLASGTVHARVVLPKGIHVGLDVFLVLPDVLIFDGEVPPTLPQPDHWQPNPPPPPETPLPDPLPEGAFGHIRPEDWLPSICVPVEPEGDDEGAAYEVSAKVVNVPLEVLPGRQKEFSNFVGKVTQSFP